MIHSLALIIGALAFAAPGEDDLDALPASLAAEPQAGRARTSFFGRVEGTLFASGVIFSGEFEADPSLGAGAQLRVPVPGLPTGKFGFFVEYALARIERDLEDFREDTDGIFHTVAVGADLTLTHQRDWFFMLQGGAAFLSFGDINGLDDGWGGLAGAVLGIHWIRGSTNALTLNPQWVYDGEDWVLFANVGVNFKF